FRLFVAMEFREVLSQIAIVVGIQMLRDVPENGHVRVGVVVRGTRDLPRRPQIVAGEVGALALDDVKRQGGAEGWFGGTGTEDALVRRDRAQTLQVRELDPESTLDAVRPAGLVRRARREVRIEPPDIWRNIRHEAWKRLLLQTGQHAIRDE